MLCNTGPSPSERASVIDAPLKLEYMHLDLTSLDSVKHFAAQLIEKDYPLHLLFCNDAVVNVPKGSRSCMASSLEGISVTLTSLIIASPVTLLSCFDCPTYAAQTIDGWEMHFQYNYLSHMYLTILLLPSLLRHDDDARVILGSSTHHTQGKLDLHNMQGAAKNSYDSKKFCANSQLYMVRSASYRGTMVVHLV